MAKPELGTKRVCPETGRKFYDLQRDPIVSPYTGKSYPVSYFEGTAPSKPVEEPKEREVEKDDDQSENEKVETVSLEDADEEKAGAGKSENAPDVDDDEDVEIENDDSDTFLESDDDEDDDDMTNIIGGRSENEEES